MVTDRQVRRLFGLVQTERTLAMAAAKAGMDEKTTRVAQVRELHLPTMRSGFEEQARGAEQETLSYERYLLERAERKCQVRRQNRIERLLRPSRLPLEKDLARFDLKRLPTRVARQVRTRLDGSFVDRKVSGGAQMQPRRLPARRSPLLGTPSRQARFCRGYIDCGLEW